MKTTYFKLLAMLVCTFLLTAYVWGDAPDIPAPSSFFEKAVSFPAGLRSLPPGASVLVDLTDRAEGYVVEAAITGNRCRLQVGVSGPGVEEETPLAVIRLLYPGGEVHSSWRVQLGGGGMSVIIENVDF